MKRFLVTATPPTTNGDLHVGHLSGPYLGADIFTKYQRLKGNQAVYLCSGDDHQSYVATTAFRKNMKPSTLVREKTQAVLRTLQAADIQLDCFTNSLENEEHIQFVQEFLVDLYQKGIFIEKTQRCYRCLTCEETLVESFITGKCPYCDEKASGNLCEACGRINNPIDLVNPTCTTCGSSPEIKEYQGLFLPIEKYKQALIAYYQSRTSWRPHLQALLNWITSQPIPDYPVTYPLKWGIPVPIQGYEDQVINVWFEMYPGHMETTRFWASQQSDEKLFEQLWSQESSFVQFLGYDNSFFNSVLHVTLSLASDGKYIPPEHIITNEFYLLENEKFSTSRNHAIWGSDILEDVPADLLRFYLSRTNPEHAQTNFSRRDFNDLVNTEVQQWTDMIDQFISLIKDEFEGYLNVDQTSLDLQIIGLVNSCRLKLERYYDLEQFSLQQASHTISQYFEYALQYFIQKVLPLRGTKSKVYHQRVASLGHFLRGFVYYLAPIMPQFSTKLKAKLGFVNEGAQIFWEDLMKNDSYQLKVNTSLSWYEVVTD